MAVMKFGYSDLSRSGASPKEAKAAKNEPVKSDLLLGASPKSAAH